MKFIGIIPARYASTRFPGKPLVDMAGKPMIQRVYEQARKALNEVWVATDDERIEKAVKQFGGNVVMTSDKHRSGTDRCCEAFKKTGSDADVIINIQGDEPFIHVSQIDLLKGCFDNPSVDIATLIKPIPQDADFEKDLFNPNIPKVVVNKSFEALYFSRSVIPYVRGKEHTEWLKDHTYFKHLGIYAYRTNIISELTQLEPSPLEIAESLEQLRWLENGYKIKTGVTTEETIGIDTPEDMEKALRFLSHQK